MVTLPPWTMCTLALFLVVHVHAIHQLQIPFKKTMRAVDPPTVNCCSLSESSLQAMKGTSSKCPSSVDFFRMLLKCQKCSPGLCRIGTKCYCPDNFLSSSAAQATCKEWFDKSWPESIGVEDVFYRSCQDNPPTISTNAISCCSVDRSTLLNIRGLTDSCPSITFAKLVRSNCEACPVGTCRVSRSISTAHWCYCPGYFLTAAALKTACLYNFGFPYPLSIGRKETFSSYANCGNLNVPVVSFPASWSATPTPTVQSPSTSATPSATVSPGNTPAAPSAVNCCSLDQSTLESMEGTTSECPSAADYLSSLAEKSQKCLPGLCRIGTKCFCPDTFLPSPTVQANCKEWFEKSWPESIEVEDIYYRSCLDNPPTISTSAISCCALDRSSLLNMRGLTNICPSISHVERVTVNCSACPQGTCRVSDTLWHSCYCPGYFLSTTGQQWKCRETFGAVYPDSIGRKEKSSSFGSCSNLDIPTITFANGSIVQVGNDLTPSTSPIGTTVLPSQNTTITTSSPLSTITASTTSTDTLSTLEIIGIVAGVVSAVVAVLGIFQFLRVQNVVARRRATNSA